MAKRKKKEEDVDSYRREAEARKDAVPVGLASYDTSDIELKNIKTTFS